MLLCVPKLTLVAPLLLWLFLFGTTSHLSCEHVVIAVRHCMARTSAQFYTLLLVTVQALTLLLYRLECIATRLKRNRCHCLFD